jgi:hypothetical protein
LSTEAPKPEKEEKPKGKILAGKDSPDFYFCIVPFDSKNPLGGDIDFYLVNDSNYTVMFQYAHYKEEIIIRFCMGLQPIRRKNWKQ